MNVIGVNAINLQYKAFYIRIKEVLDNIFAEDELLKNRLDDADIILLDELDKVYQKTDWATHNIDDFLRRYLKDKSIIIASNWSKEEIKENFGASIFSLLSEYNKFVVMSGEDFRQKLNADWMKRLDTKENINMSHLKSQSKIWFENSIKKLEKIYDIVVK